MFAGTLLTLGILAMIGGFGSAFLMVMGAAMSDNPSASDDAVNSAWLPAIIGLVGVATIVGALVLHFRHGF